MNTKRIIKFDTHGLKVGDRVMIADAVGDVMDRTRLVTRIRTIKNVVITLPNTMVMQNQVTNYSADARNNSLILHTRSPSATMCPGGGPTTCWFERRKKRRRFWNLRPHLC